MHTQTGDREGVLNATSNLGEVFVLQIDTNKCVRACVGGGGEGGVKKKYSTI